MLKNIFKANPRRLPVALLVVAALVTAGVLVGTGRSKPDPSKVSSRSHIAAIRRATPKSAAKAPGDATPGVSHRASAASTTTTSDAAPGTTPPSSGSSTTGPTTTSTTGASQSVQLAGGVAWVTTKHTMVSGGISRYYLVLTPQNMGNRRLPVVMVLHGSSVTPYREVHRTNFFEVSGPAILVYPAGYREFWDAGACCGYAWQAHINDVAFLNSVLQQVRSAYPQASTSKTYLAGYSNGGKMALMLACKDPGTFAGVAVYGAVPTYACPSIPPTSLMEVAGTADPELNIGPSGKGLTVNGYTMPTVIGEVDAYLRTDGCSSASAASVHGTVHSTIWTHCSGGRRVGLALFEGQNHHWPEGNGATPSAQQVMWNFFTSLGA